MFFGCLSLYSHSLIKCANLTFSHSCEAICEIETKSRNETLRLLGYLGWSHGEMVSRRRGFLCLTSTRFKITRQANEWWSFDVWPLIGGLSWRKHPIVTQPARTIEFYRGRLGFELVRHRRHRWGQMRMWRK